MVLITWDEPKRLANIDKHGFDFRDVDEGFFLGAMAAPTKSGRYLAVGLLHGGAVAVVFAPLGSEALSIISMRAASAAERKLLR